MPRAEEAQEALNAAMRGPQLSLSPFALPPEEVTSKTARLAGLAGTASLRTTLAAVLPEPAWETPASRRSSPGARLR